MDKLVEIHPARDIPHAHMIEAVLENHGIEVRISNLNLHMGGGELPMGLSTAPGIQVFESDAERALELIRELERGAHSI